MTNRFFRNRNLRMSLPLFIFSEPADLTFSSVLVSNLDASRQLLRKTWSNLPKAHLSTSVGWLSPSRLRPAHAMALLQLTLLGVRDADTHRTSSVADPSLESIHHLRYSKRTLVFSARSFSNSNQMVIKILETRGHTVRAQAVRSPPHLSAESCAAPYRRLVHNWASPVCISECSCALIDQLLTI